MKVSVLMTVYNQEEYIAQAVDSILMQEAPFDYEIVIGEDVSTDRTREIVLELEKRHPDKIRVMLRDAAVSERDRERGLGGKTNFVQGLQDCRGEYVALLDGDDFWTDPHKLQKLVGFMESHPECSVSFHDVMTLYEDGSEAPRRLFPADQPKISTLEDMIIAGMFPIPCSALFRNRLLRKLPDCFDSVVNGDWMLFVLLAEHGNVGYLNEVMATYRVHGQGFWSQLNHEQGIQEHIKFFEMIDSHLSFKYTRVISQKLAALRKSLRQQHARSCLDQYHKLVKKGAIRKPFRLLLEATQSAPLEVLRPRRFLAVLKNGLLGVIHTERNQN